MLCASSLLDSAGDELEARDLKKAMGRFRWVKQRVDGLQYRAVKPRQQ